ncbi:hypothetical protein B0H17DRAFT_845228, partial [Mycena rosella]
SDDIFDEVAAMIDDEREQFMDATKDIRSALGKLRTLANKIINSSTKLLPRWRAVVEANRLKPKNLPRDVKTRWNSTFDMINTGLAYRRAIHKFT